MTPYTSNKKILEAYQKIYEAANTDGTIDGKSRYDEILHDCAVAIYKWLLKSCIERNKAEIIDSIHDAISKNGGLIKIRKDKYSPDYNPHEYDLIKGIEIPISKRAEITLHSGFVHSDDNDLKVLSGKWTSPQKQSASFRKNLSSPKFPDKQRDDEDKTYNEENYQDH